LRLICSIDFSGDKMTSHNNDEPLGRFDDQISAMLTDHKDEIYRYADRLDKGDQDLSELLDDVADEIKGHLGAAAANAGSDHQAETALEAAERWVAENISNSTGDRRVAGVYALLGVDQARRRLSGDAEIRCNKCMQLLGEEDLVRGNDATDGERSDACPVCGTDNYLMDLNSK